MTSPNTDRTVLIIPADLLAAIDRAAKLEDRNRSQWMRQAARDKLAREEGK